MTLPTGGIVKLAQVGTIATAAQWVCTYYFRKTSTGAEDEFSIANDFTTNLMAAWRAMVGDETVWVGTEYTQLYPTPGVTLEVGTTAPNNGTNARGSVGWMPACLAQHAILRTGLAGRSNRGRMYQPPAQFVGSPVSDSFFWGPLQVAHFQTFLSTIRTRYNGPTPAIGFEWGVFSYVHSGPADPTHPRRGPWSVPHFNPITTATALAGIRTQKRREAPSGT